MMASVSTGEAEKRREEKRETLLNRLLNRNTYTITSFYVGQEELPILQQFRLTAKCEAGPRGFGKVLVKAMAEYNERHKEGNPQLKIASYLPHQDKGPIRVLCNFIGGALSEGRVFCRKGQMWIASVRCYSCEKNKLRKAEKK
jgi:hypothetical protein